MDQRSAEIVREIDEERQRLADDVAQLEGKVREAADWRRYFARKPWTMLGIVFAGGFFMSGFFNFRSR